MTGFDLPPGQPLDMPATDTASCTVRVTASGVNGAVNPAQALVDCAQAAYDTVIAGVTSQDRQPVLGTGYFEVAFYLECYPKVEP